MNPQSPTIQGPIQPPANTASILSYPRPNTEEDDAESFRVPELSRALLRSAIVASDQLDSLQIIPRECLCGTWFRRADLGFVFGQRGLGKTWWTLNLARCLGEGRNFGPWEIKTPQKVLYVDGEMPFDAMRDRNRALTQGPGELHFLNHEWLFQQTGCVLNLSDAITQAVLKKVCEEEGIRVLILDNLSCLFSGVAENDADAWEQVLPWLLNLRRRQIAVIIVHHANRAGYNMRGTSRREDAAFWVVRLDAVNNPVKDVDGATFISRFTKCRQGTAAETEPLEWIYQPDGVVTKVTAKRTPTIEVFKGWVREGLNSCSDIAQEMGLTKGAVSKLARRGEREGWLMMKGRSYQLIDIDDPRFLKDPDTQKTGNEGNETGNQLVSTSAP